MKCYLGIDLGTTNSKALVLQQDGNLYVVRSEKTKKYVHEGVEFFNLSELERFVDESLTAAKRYGDIAGICFSSVGESVVPVTHKGESLHDPIVWYDRITEQIEKEVLSQIGGEDYIGCGIDSNFTLGLFKMTWMKRHLLQDVDKPFYFLPVSDYFSFRLTGEAVWSYSQACRSYCFDIHTRTWNENTTRITGVREHLPPVHPSGHRLHKRYGDASVYLGGHDHILGMYGIDSLFREEAYFYSMGSASVLGGFTSIAKNHMEHLMKNSPGMTIGVSHSINRYYVENSLRYFGKLHDAVSHWYHAESPKQFYDDVNDFVEKLQPEHEIPFFLVEGDRLNKEQTTGINMMNLSVQTDQKHVVYGLYVYLGLMSKIILDEVAAFEDKPNIVAGGGIVKNPPLIQFIADIIGKPIHILNQQELTALGAALTAAEENGDQETIEQLRAKVETSLVEPSSNAEIRQKQAAGMKKAIENMLCKLTNNNN